jgi:hypothetical protein
VVCHVRRHPPPACPPARSWCQRREPGANFLGSTHAKFAEHAAWFDVYAPPTLNTATLILDHPPKSGDTARGSSRKLDAVDVSWELSGRFSPDSAGAVTLKLTKARDGGLPDKVVFTVGGTPFRFERGESRRVKPEERTLNALEDGMTAGEWLDASGLKERTFYVHREKLIDAGLVEARGGTYCKVAVASWRILQ